MTQQEMYVAAHRKLKQLETEYGIRVLYAAESGSRAWGTHAETSDFDIRFIYIRPKEDYLRLDPVRDVLEFPIEDGWDMCGWDLTKTLQLLHNSNSQIYEWFGSGVVYWDEGFSRRFRPVLDACFSVKTGTYHYLHQAKLKTKKSGKMEMPKVKHYLYALQHLWSAQWVLRHAAPPPVSFAQLMAQQQGWIRQEAEFLLEQKTAHPEQPQIPRRPELDAWLAEESSRIQQRTDRLPKEPELQWQMLNDFFRSELERL